MASLLFFIGKKDGKFRPCQDYKYLNDHTVKNAYPIPMISEIIDTLKGAKWFTKLDIWLSYNNVYIQEGDQWKAAFKTLFGLFKPTIMFFGMCNSPAMFQSMMNTIFTNLIDKGGVIIYMDDILIYIKTEKELEQHMKEVLGILKDNDLFLKTKKCQFHKQHMEYLGIIISPNKIKMDPKKLNGIREWPTPWNTKDVQKFIGFCNFYRKFIHNYSNITQPLNKLLSKNRKFKWIQQAQELFHLLKTEFQKEPVLIMPNQTKPFEIESNASKHATGAILYQYNINGNRKPITFYSKTLILLYLSGILHSAMPIPSWASIQTCSQEELEMFEGRID